MKVGDPGRLGPARIDDNEGFLRVFGDPQQLPRGLGNLVALHPVPAEYQEVIRLLRVDLQDQRLAAEHAAGNPEQAGELLAQGAVVEAGSQTPHQADTEARLEVAPLAAAPHVGKGFGAVPVDDIPELRRDLADGLIPGDPFEPVSDSLQGVLQAVGIVLVIGDVHAFPADIALAPDIALVALDLDNSIVLHLDHQAAVLGAEDTAGLVCGSHRFFLSPISVDLSVNPGLPVPEASGSVQAALPFPGLPGFS